MRSHRSSRNVPFRVARFLCVLIGAIALCACSQAAPGNDGSADTLVMPDAARDVRDDARVIDSVDAPVDAEDSPSADTHEAAAGDDVTSDVRDASEPVDALDVALDASDSDFGSDATESDAVDIAPDVTASDDALDVLPDDLGFDDALDTSPDVSAIDESDDALDASLDVIAIDEGLDAIDESDDVLDATPDLPDVADDLADGVDAISEDAAPCAADLSVCDEACVDLSADPRNCGACHHDCTTLPNVSTPSEVRCDRGTCSVPATACSHDFMHCSSNPDDGCESDRHDPAHCGDCTTRCSSSSACATDSAGRFFCFGACGGLTSLYCYRVGCVDPNRNPLHCGSCSTVCPSIPNSDPVCTSGVCRAPRCFPAFHSCGGACVDSGSPDHCGSLCDPCVAPPHASATCNGTACDFVCDPFYVRAGDSCVATAAPRLIGPLSTSIASTIRPTFRWSLATGTDGAQIEWCRDRACTSPIASATVMGTSVRITDPLPSGPVFWRARAVVAAMVDTTSSSTWEVFVPTRDTPVDTAAGSIYDPNGDGLADAIVGSADAAFEYDGAPGGPSTTATRVLYPFSDSWNGFGDSVASAGDVDGDGFGDLVVGVDGTYWAEASLAPQRLPPGRIAIFRGGVGGIATTPSQIVVAFGGNADGFGAAVGGVGDVNGDGYGDVLAYQTRPARALLFYGSAAGLVTTPAATLVAPGPFVRMTFGSGDVNGDGFGDIVTSTSERGIVYLGSATGVVMASELTSAEDTEMHFGHQIAVGDLDGDGYDDVTILAPHRVPYDPTGTMGPYTVDAGRVYLYRGSPSGPHDPGVVLFDGTTDRWLEGGVSLAGDMNADGIDDAILGTSQFPVGGGRSAAVAYIAGDPVAFATPVLIPSPTAGGGSRFGDALAIVGDVDGDGLPDAIVGDWGAVYGNGDAYVVRGNPDPSALAVTTTFVNPTITGRGVTSVGVSVGR